MSYSADLEHDLETLAGMLPLSERETQIAVLMFRDGDIDLIQRYPNEFSEKAQAAFKAVAIAMDLIDA